jgi:hypothetical protein
MDLALPSSGIQRLSALRPFRNFTEILDVAEDIAFVAGVRAQFVGLTTWWLARCASLRSAHPTCYLLYFGEQLYRIK